MVAGDYPPLPIWRDTGATMTWDQHWLHGTRAAGFPRAMRLALMGLVALCIATLLAGGAFLLLHNLVMLPGAYERLSTSGVEVTGTVVACRNTRAKVCDLTYAYQGPPKTITYGQHTDQFGAPGSKVTLLVDPSDPSTAFTKQDVDTRYREGYEIPMGELLLLLSLMVVTAFVYTATRHRSAALGRQPAH
jgi:hypothetical protein